MVKWWLMIVHDDYWCLIMVGCDERWPIIMFEDGHWWPMRVDNQYVDVIYGIYCLLMKRHRYGRVSLLYVCICFKIYFQVCSVRDWWRHVTDTPLFVGSDVSGYIILVLLLLLEQFQQPSRIRNPSICYGIVTGVSSGWLSCLLNQSLRLFFSGW